MGRDLFCEFCKLAIESCFSFVGLCTICALDGSKIGLKLLVFKKFTPIITGRDKFFKTTAEPEKMVERLLNLILTSVLSFPSSNLN